MDLKHLNLKYALVNIALFLLLAGIAGFTYNYLSQMGFGDRAIGGVLMAASLIGVFAGPVAGDIADRSPKVTQRGLIAGAMVGCALFAGALLLLPAGSALVAIMLVACYMCATIVMPLLNGVAFIYEKEGGRINYGLCRGLGSASYAVGSTIVGRLWSTLGTRTLPIWTIAGAALTLAAILLMPEAPEGRDDRDDRADKREGISVPQFFGKYRQLVPVIVSLVLIFECHNLINSYMAKAVGMFATSDIERVQGNALFIAAILELPMMFGFSIVLERLGIRRIMVISAVAFSLKHVMTFLCVSVPMFYVAMALQIFSYAALYPATVYFANAQIDEADRNKGQAVFSATNTVAAVLASLLGGWLFTLIPVRAVLGLGAALSICGTALMIYALRTLPRQDPPLGHS